MFIKRAVLFLSIACGKKNGGAPSVAIRGKLDGQTIAAASIDEKGFLFGKMLARFLSSEAFADPAAAVTGILAIRSDLNITSAAPAMDGSFSLSVENGNAYILCFLTD